MDNQSVLPNSKFNSRGQDQTSERRILGIDPGLQITGYGIIEGSSSGPKVCEAGVIRANDDTEASDLAQRIRSV